MPGYDENDSLLAFADLNVCGLSGYLDYFLAGVPAALVLGDIEVTLTPSARGELEITDLNRVYLDRNALAVTQLGRGFAWLDTGTHDSLIAASEFVRTVQKGQGMKISCVEEIAYRMGFIDESQLAALAGALGDTEYAGYLNGLIKP